MKWNDCNHECQPVTGSVNALQPYSLYSFHFYFISRFLLIASNVTSLHNVHLPFPVTGLMIICKSRDGHLYISTILSGCYTAIHFIMKVNRMEIINIFSPICLQDITKKSYEQKSIVIV